MDTVARTIRSIEIDAASAARAANAIEDLYNDTLSARRARAVQEHLISSYRVDPSRLQSIGFGERKLADPSYPEGPVNRRVEVIGLTQFAAQ